MTQEAPAPSNVSLHTMTARIEEEILWSVVRLREMEKKTEHHLFLTSSFKNARGAFLHCESTAV
jgi:hypothetical protein